MLEEAMNDGLKSCCKGKRRSGVLALLVIFSISLAVLAALATLLPAVSATEQVTATASIAPPEITLGNIATITLNVNSNSSSTPEDVRVFYVLSNNITYIEGTSTIPPNITIGNTTITGDPTFTTLIWDIAELESTWTTSFDVVFYPVNETVNRSVSIARDSKVTYSSLNSTDNVPIEGVINVTPSSSPDNEFSLTYLQNGTIISFITRDDLHPTSNFTGYSGNAIHIKVTPQGVNQGLTINNLPYTDILVEGNTYDIWSDSMTVNLSNSHDGEALGEWWIAINATNATITGHKHEELFSPLVVDVTTCYSSEIVVSAQDGYIGQPVGITGHALLSNPGDEKTDVIVKFYVDGFPLWWTVIPVHPTEEDISVSTTWIPMSSGLHSISMQMYVLSYDGTEFWTEAQGPNEATNSTTVYIRRVS